jgi:hypothetical protein
LNKRLYGQIEQWRQRPIEGEHPYVYLDGIWLKRSWGGEVKNVAVLVAVGLGRDGFRQVLGAMEGAKEDKESWVAPGEARPTAALELVLEGGRTLRVRSFDASWIPCILI